MDLRPCDCGAGRHSRLRGAAQEAAAGQFAPFTALASLPLDYDKMYLDRAQDWCSTFLHLLEMQNVRVHAPIHGRTPYAWSRATPPFPSDGLLAGPVCGRP